MKNKKIASLIALSVVAFSVIIPSASQAAAPKIKLHIAISSASAGPSQIIDLSCNPDSKKVARAHALCASLIKVGLKAFDPTPRMTACSMIYGGDQIAIVKGTWGKKIIDAKFARTNGCGVARWAKLGFLLGKY